MSFFEGYDYNLVVVALPQLRGAFHLTQAQASLWISLLYLGGLPAIILGRQADRWGRRRLLLFSIWGYTITSAATALAHSILWFAVLQFAARLFLNAETGVVWTVVAEELPAAARGLGFGWLATLNAVGTGAAAIVYGGVLAPAGISWRWLYIASTPLLVLVAFWRRQVPETKRFAAASARGQLARRWQAILRAPYRRRLLFICTASLLSNLTAQATVFVVDFMQTQRHLSPSAADLILLAAGAAALPTLIIVGNASDRHGRKPTAAMFLSLASLGPIFFFFFARGPLWLLAALALDYVGEFGTWPTVGAFGPELFPTALRALGSSWAGASKVLGQFLSFLLAGELIAVTGSVPGAAAALAVGPLLAAGVIALWLPETGGRELEEIAEERR
jgi:putative MFS transporter